MEYLERNLLRQRSFTEQIFIQYQERYFRIKYSFIESCVVYEVTWKNMVQTDRHGAHNNIYETSVKNIETHLEYVYFLSCFALVFANCAVKLH